MQLNAKNICRQSLQGRHCWLKACHMSQHVNEIFLQLSLLMHKFNRMMIMQVHFIRHLMRKFVFGRHQDLNPRPSDSCLVILPLHCLLNSDLHLSDQPLSPYWWILFLGQSLIQLMANGNITQRLYIQRSRCADPLLTALCYQVHLSWVVYLELGSTEPRADLD